MRDRDAIEYGKLWVELAAIVKDNSGDTKPFRSITNDEVALNTSFLFKQMLKDINSNEIPKRLKGFPNKSKAVSKEKET